MDLSTIAAIATPSGRAGIGIIKISGPDAVSIASALFRQTAAAGAPARCRFKSHRLYHGFVLDPQSGSVLDEVLLSVMRGPRSYTGEEVVEINTHSGTVVLKAVLDLVLQNGARLAEPGEFTKRAFLNGRIDLTQAEAVIDIINARSEQALALAAAHMGGGLKNRILTIREALVNVMAPLEAAIDFPEDVEPADAGMWAERLRQDVLQPLEALVRAYSSAHFFREGLRLAVVGRPNVGKSSLMNRLVCKERTIVSPYPGTTRDFIEESIEINGIPVVVADTAGLHPTLDPVETIGILKTRDYIDSCDLVLLVLDASTVFDAEDRRIFESVRADRMILVLNKQDLVTAVAGLQLPPDWQGLPQARISALYNQGIDALKDLIATVCTGDARLDIRGRIIPNLRQKRLLEQGLQAARTAAGGFDDGRPCELTAIDLREAANALAEIVGLDAREDILDQIFARFCIGK